MIRTSNMNTENNKIAIICITENGKKLALEMQNKLHEGDIYFVKREKSTELQEVCNISNDDNAKINTQYKSIENIVRIKEKLSNFIPTIFNKYRYIIFIISQIFQIYYFCNLLSPF